MACASHNVRGVAVLALLASACTGKVGATADAGAGAGAVSDGWPRFGTTTEFGLRRLTSEQYIATVQTLLGVSTAGMPAIEKVSPAAGFSAIGASTAAVSSAGVAAFEDAARFLAHPRSRRMARAPRSCRARPRARTTRPASASSSPRSARAPFAGRSPATRPPATRRSRRTVAAATGDPWQGLEAITSAFLQSPSFLYLPEVGAPDPQSAGRYKFTGYEMASRLSYFLTNDMPDDALFAAAASGALDTPDGVRAQAERLLALPAAHDAVRAFFATLLSLDNLDTLTRPTAIFPQFTPTLGAAMKQETALVIDDLVFARDGDYRHLFDQTETFVNAELAALYGVPAPAGTGFAR